MRVASSTDDQGAEGRGQRGWFAVFMVGVGLYSISLGALAAEVNIGILGDSRIEGWEALFWSLVGWGESTYIGLSGVTNFVMWSNLAFLRPRWRYPLKGMGLALLIAAVFNLGWLYEPISYVELSQIRVGYYLWLASFGIVGIAHLTGSRKVENQPPSP